MKDGVVSLKSIQVDPGKVGGGYLLRAYEPGQMRHRKERDVLVGSRARNLRVCHPEDTPGCRELHSEQHRIDDEGRGRAVRQMQRADRRIQLKQSAVAVEP